MGAQYQYFAVLNITITRSVVTFIMTITKFLVTFTLLLSVSGALAQDDDVPSCQPGDHLLPDPDDCDSYYACTSGGEAVAIDSPETLECVEGMTACLLSSEEDDKDAADDAIDF